MPYKDKAARRANYIANKEKVKVQTKAYRAANEEKVKAWGKAWHAENRKRILDYDRKRHLKQKYGLTLEGYAQIFETQDGRCKICGRKPGKKMLAVDHCHKTLKIRGLLCGNCNQGLGNFKDDLSLLLKAAAYLEEHA